MKYIRHPKIINLYAMCSQVQPFCIVTDLVHDNLLEYLQGKILHTFVYVLTYLRYIFLWVVVVVIAW